MLRWLHAVLADDARQHELREVVVAIAGDVIAARVDDLRALDEVRELALEGGPNAARLTTRLVVALDLLPPSAAAKKETA